MLRQKMFDKCTKGELKAFIHARMCKTSVPSWSSLTELPKNPKKSDWVALAFAKRSKVVVLKSVD